MQQPKAVDAPIDADRIAAWVEKYADYHRRPTKPRLLSWLDQFDDGPDRDLAARILDAVEYWSHENVEDALVRRAQSLPGWSERRSSRNGRWRFVAFARAAGESGNAMLHKFRIAAKMTGATNDHLFIEKRDLLRENLTSRDTVVFIDDFSGTGKQICDCWEEVMGELLPGNPRIFLLLLAARHEAIHRITLETPLKVAAARTLRSQDNIFSVNCRHFRQRDQRRILDYCRRVDPVRPRGFGSCGLAVVLAHNAPNNSIPILHHTTPDWTPIFPRR